MTTLATTFEHDLRERLLDVVYGQWHALGVPFSQTLRAEATDVIDPEALLWCSLEFLPTEPRLREGVAAWLAVRGNYIIRQKVKRLVAREDARADIWCALEGVPELRRGVVTPEPCHGVASSSEVSDFCKKLGSGLGAHASDHTPPGNPVQGPSTVLVRARDLLGADLRHALLVYLLGSPDGGKLKTLERWSRYSYRSISETAARWETAGVLTIDRGYCRLTNARPWEQLLRCRAGEATIVDWVAVFEACIRLLRALAKADRRGLGTSTPILSSFLREAQDALSSAVLGGERGRSSSASSLQELVGGYGPSA